MSAWGKKRMKEKKRMEKKAGIQSICGKQQVDIVQAHNGELQPASHTATGTHNTNDLLLQNSSQISIYLACKAT